MVLGTAAIVREQRKTNALLETIGAILLHQTEIQDSVTRSGVYGHNLDIQTQYSVLELRKSLIAAAGKK